tara:strand:- start:2744 stop:3403 length:660 start_codon:yes stop_codon:yes gene_type:complete
MSFKKQKYKIIKKAISKDLATFAYNYFLMKRQVAKTFFDTKFISPFTSEWGVWTDEQVPNTYSHYADILSETLLLKLQPVVENETKLKLTPNYTYTRIYKKGDILRRHKDRFSCEISTTLNLGGENWPIYLDPTGANNVIDEYKNLHKPNAPKGIKVNLKPGDMLIYRGCDLEHWRDPFIGEDCCQVFLHYNNTKTKGSKENLFDKRPHLGLPNYFKNK